MCKGKKVFWSEKEIKAVAKQVSTILKSKKADIKDLRVNDIKIIILQAQKVVLPKERCRPDLSFYCGTGVNVLNSCYTHCGYRRGYGRRYNSNKTKVKVNVNTNTETKPKVTDLQQLFVNMTDLLAHPTYGKAIKAMLK